MIKNYLKYLFDFKMKWIAYHQIKSVEDKIFKTWLLIKSTTFDPTIEMKNLLPK